MDPERARILLRQPQFLDNARFVIPMGAHSETMQALMWMSWRPVEGPAG